MLYPFWSRLLSPTTPIEEAMRDLGQLVKELLDGIDAGEAWTTTQLADFMLPPDGLDDLELKRRNRIYTILLYRDKKTGKPTFLPTWRRRSLVPVHRKLRSQGNAVYGWEWFDPTTVEADINPALTTTPNTPAEPIDPDADIL